MAAPTLLEAAQLSFAAYDPTQTPVGWQLVLNDPVTGLLLKQVTSDGSNSFSVFTNGTDSLVIAFKGSDNLDNYESDIGNDGGSQWEEIKKQFELVLADLRDTFPTFHIYTDGHSLGGGMAQTAALENDLDGFGQNSLPVSAMAQASDDQLADGFAAAYQNWQGLGHVFLEANVAGEIATAYYSGKSYISTSVTTLPNPYAAVEVTSIAVGDELSSIGVAPKLTITAIDDLVLLAFAGLAHSIKTVIAEEVLAPAAPPSSVVQELSAEDPLIEAMTTDTDVVNANGSVTATDTSGDSATAGLISSAPTYDTYSFSSDGGPSETLVVITAGTDQTFDTGVLNADAVDDLTGGDTINVSTLALTIITINSTINIAVADAKLTIVQPTQFTGTIIGFVRGDTIDLSDIGTAASATLGANNVLTVTGGSGGPITLNLDPNQDYSNARFLISGDSDGGTNINLIKPAASEVLFAGIDSSGYEALWSTDGTAADTQEIYSGTLSSLTFAVFGDSVLFSRYDANGNLQLWVTDGTTSGTKQLTSVPNPGGVSYVAVIGTKAVFTAPATDGSGHLQLWSTDGTTSGTTQLTSTMYTDSAGQVAGVSPEDTISEGSFALFLGSSLSYTAQYSYLGSSLWVTDGTSSGTHELTADQYETTGNHNLDDFQYARILGSVGTKGLFEDENNNIWVTDGTSAGTTAIAYNAIGLSGVSVLGQSVFYLAYGATGYSGTPELWVTTGNPSAATQLTGLNKVSGEGQYPTEVTVYGSLELFQSQSNLWASDGTVAGTKMIASVAPEVITPSSGKAFFVANGQLWDTDGTAAGTQQITDIAGLFDGLSATQIQLTAFGQKALFVANNPGASGSVLWTTDGTTAGTHALSSALNPSDITVVGNKALFNGSADGNSYQLWVTDGTPAGTEEITNVTDASGDSLAPDNITPLSGITSIACFCRGTLIATDQGEVAVESLAAGSLVTTGSGLHKPVRWIGRRSYSGWLAAGNPKVMPICFKAGSLDDQVPRRDLFVSPEHAMLIEGHLIPAGLLVNGESILKLEAVDEIHYFHIELDQHDVILAERALSETFVDDGSRSLFHNAAEYHALHPKAVRKDPPSYCAPRLEEGFALELIRERLAARAGRLRPDGRATVVDIHGHHDVGSRDRITGWAHDRRAPGRRVPIVVLCNGAVLARVTADRYRADLEQAGIGDGYHSFEVVLGTALDPDQRHEVELRSGDDWSLLLGSPIVLEPLASGNIVPLPHTTAVALPGVLQGRLDTCDSRRLTGWALDKSNPGQPLALTVSVNDQIIGRVLANRLRDDVRAAGFGPGRHGFDFIIPDGLSRFKAHVIRVRREADGTELTGSPYVLPAQTAGDCDLDGLLADILHRADGSANEDQALALLTRQTEALLARRAQRTSGRVEREALRLFQRRWGREPAGAEVTTGIAGPRALVIDQHVPRASRDAGSGALLSHVRALVALGYQVTFSAAGEMGEEVLLRQLADQEGISVCGRPHYSCIEDVLCRQAESFDIVYLHRHSMAHRYAPLVRTYMRQARLIYSVADLHHLRLSRQAQVEGRPELLALARSTERAEHFAAAQSDLVFTHSPVEAAMLRRHFGAHKVHVVPFAVTPRRARRRLAGRHGIGFIGGVDHAPNSDAVFWLVNEILPRVWARNPTLICKIVGHGWAPHRPATLDPRVEIVGPVAELDEVLATLRLTVAPLRFGAGIKGKVLESFAAGVPCVMSEVAAEGLPLSGLLTGLVGRGAESIADLIIHYHDQSKANTACGSQALALVKQHFQQNHVEDSFRAALGVAYGVTADVRRLVG